MKESATANILSEETLKNMLPMAMQAGLDRERQYLPQSLSESIQDADTVSLSDHHHEPSYSPLKATTDRLVINDSVPPHAVGGTNFQNLHPPPLGFVPSQRCAFVNELPGVKESYIWDGYSQPNYVSPQPATNPEAIMLNLSVLQHRIKQLNAVLLGSAPDVDKHQAVSSGVASIIYELIVTGAAILFSSQQQQVVISSTPRINYSTTDLPLGSGIALGSDVLFNQDNQAVGLTASDPLDGGRPGFGRSTHVLHDSVGIPLSSFHQKSMVPSNSAHGFTTLEVAGIEMDCHDNNNWIENSFSEEYHLREGRLSKQDLDSGYRSRDGDAPSEQNEKYCIDRISCEIVEMDATEILAEHTHFCEICGKGFRRDANLRMHMRAHGNKYKTLEALAKPHMLFQDSADVMRPRRYSCPYGGCRRNRKHKKFQPLKSVVCVKNHYKRSHCPKLYTCNKCHKSFSVVGDLKMHGKNCGQNKWQCSCGTTFTRKDKLFGHITLFKGHTPAFPMGEVADTAVKDGRNPVDTINRNAWTVSAKDCSASSEIFMNPHYRNLNVESCFGKGTTEKLKTGYYDAYIELGLENSNFLNEDTDERNIDSRHS